MKTIYVAANGCAVLRHETNRVLTFFIKNGYVECDSPIKANIILFSGCGMTNEDVSFDIQIINDLHTQKKTGTKLIVMGCLPAVYDKIKSISDEIVILKYDELNILNHLIPTTIKLEDVTYNVGFESHLVWPRQMDEVDIIEDEKLLKKIPANSREGFEEFYRYSTAGKYIWKEKDVFQIRIAYGCSYSCSYCASRLAVGKYKSVPIQNVLDQFQTGIEKGFTKFMLIGTELGNYGKEFDSSISDLISLVYQINNKIRVGIRYIHPDCLVKNFLKLQPFLENGFVYYFCAAIQTSSARLLKDMNRNPDLGKFIECIRTINLNKMPVFKHTQIMVGFPGETYQDIFNTIDLLDSCNFNFVNVNKFSSRPMTAAHKYEHQISEEEKDRRLNLVKQWLAIKRKELLYEQLKKIFSDFHE